MSGFSASVASPVLSASHVPFYREENWGHEFLVTHLNTIRKWSAYNSNSDRSFQEVNAKSFNACRELSVQVCLVVCQPWKISNPPRPPPPPKQKSSGAVRFQSTGCWFCMDFVFHFLESFYFYRTIGGIWLTFWHCPPIMFLGMEVIRQSWALPSKTETNGFRLYTHESRCGSITKQLWAMILEKCRQFSASS